jgi:phage terminase large subunit-like protein
MERVLHLNGGEHEGAPFTLLPWQAFIVGSLFGWKSSDGYRRFRQAFIEAGKGCGKSPLAAAIGLYMMLADNEPRAEIYAAAAAKDQAKILFRDAVAMVDQSPALLSIMSRAGKQENTWKLTHRASGSTFAVIASDSPKSGFRPHCAILDEIHEHKDRNVVSMMRAGTKGRRQALIFMITNSGQDRLSVCFELHTYAIKVAARMEEDDGFFSYVCALDLGDDPFKDPTCWIKANPSLGVTIHPRYLEERVREAVGMPGQQADVRRLNYCQWTEIGAPWIDADAWLSCEQETSADWLAGLPVALGIDLSEKSDLTAIARAHMDEYGNIRAQVDFWMAGDTVDVRSRAERVPFRQWVNEGHMHAPDGVRIDYEHVAAILGQIGATSEVTLAAYDQWHMKYLQKELDALEIGLPLIAHPQGPIRRKEASLWMPHSIRMLEKAIAEGRLQVRINPVLRWCASNATVKADNQGNKIFDKMKATGRIDGVVALAMAVGALYAENTADVAGMLG